MHSKSSTTGRLTQFCRVASLAITMAAGAMGSMSSSAFAQSNNPEAIPMPFDARVVVFPYDPRAIYALYGTVGSYIHIELQPGEVATQAPVMGDTIRWMMSGGPSNFFVKPVFPGVQTSLTVVTNRRAYTFDLRAGAEGAKRYAKVGFTYPLEDAAIRFDQEAQAKSRAAIQERARADLAATEVPESRGSDLSSMNFKYEWSRTLPWAPTFVADNGKQIFMQFPAGQPAPTIFVADDPKNSVMVNVVPRENGMVVVPRMAGRLSLHVGKDIVIVERPAGGKEYRPSDSSSGTGRVVN